MKRFIKHLSFLLAALCLFSCINPVFAEDSKYSDEYFETHTWDEIIADFIAEEGCFKTQTAFGYKNLVTGEEGFYNGDKYMFAASVYKLPLNMYYAAKIASGELEWDSTVWGYPLEFAMENSIVWSDNDVSGALWRGIGNFNEYRDTMAPLVGLDLNDVDPIYYRENYYTAGQIIFCLNLLYEGGDETYPRIIEYMLRAEPERYFKAHPHDVEIAHKYGYVQSSDNHLYLNDCGIVFTDEPFAIVVFTDNINQPARVIADYCDLMIAYTEYHSSHPAEQPGVHADEALQDGN